MPPTLLDMPIEMLDAIVDGLPEDSVTEHRRRDDLKQLRLTCREIEEKTRIRFGREFFFGLVARIVPGGFDTAQHVLDDAIFRQSVRSLDIHTGPILPPFQEGLVHPPGTVD